MKRRPHPSGAPGGNPVELPRRRRPAPGRRGRDAARAPREWLSPWRATAIYAVAGALWILVTDRLLELWIGERATLLGPAQTAKGWLFILITGAFLFLLIQHASRRLQRSERGRVAAEERYRLLVDGIRDYAILLLDPEGRVATWSSGAQSIYGYGTEEVLGKPYGIFHPPESREAGEPQDLLRRTSREGRVETQGWRERKDGTRFWCAVVLTALYDPQGSFNGFAKVAQDRTDRHITERKLRQAQKMEAVGQLTGGLAHDFNNLLTVILGNLELARERVEESRNEAELSTAISRALDAVERGTVLNQRLLAFARQQPLDPEPVDLNRTVSAMHELVRRTLGSNIQVETVLAGGLWPAMTDPAQVETALLNLALNARDAMARGGKLTIETANVRLDDEYATGAGDVSPGPYVMLAVSDTGSGMSPEVLDRAFDPFFTTKESGRGSGLGLSMVYGFVKQCGGHIRVYSEVGEGTVVRIYLPRARHAAVEATPAAEPPQRAGARGETILVVEDEPALRGLVKVLLERQGYQILTAADADAALGILERTPGIALLFTDVIMPGGMNGRELADRARQMWPELKALFTSGYSESAVVHGGRLDADVELLTKPFTREQLLRRVRRLLDEG